MAVTVKSVESERPHVSHGVALSSLPRINPGEIWAHIYWDTPLSNVLNFTAAKIADAGDGIQQIQKRVDKHIGDAVQGFTGVFDGIRRIHRNGIRGNFEDIRLSYITRNLSSEDADMVCAFSRCPLRRRSQEKSGEENIYTAAYVLDIDDGQHGYEPSVTQVLWRRPSLAPTQPLPLPSSYYRHDYQEYPPPPPGQVSYYERDHSPQLNNSRPFEVELLHGSSARRVENMRQQVTGQEEERMRQKAAIEYAVDILLAQLDERSRLEEQQFALVQAQEEFLPTRPSAFTSPSVL